MKLAAILSPVMVPQATEILLSPDCFLLLSGELALIFSINTLYKEQCSIINNLKGLSCPVVLMPMAH